MRFQRRPALEEEDFIHRLRSEEGIPTGIVGSAGLSEHFLLKGGSYFRTNLVLSSSGAYTSVEGAIVYHWFSRTLVGKM